jgi:hypothetical protein
MGGWCFLAQVIARGSVAEDGEESLGALPVLCQEPQGALVRCSLLVDG